MVFYRRLILWAASVSVFLPTIPSARESVTRHAFPELSCGESEDVSQLLYERVFDRKIKSKHLKEALNERDTFKASAYSIGTLSVCMEVSVCIHQNPYFDNTNYFDVCIFRYSR